MIIEVIILYKRFISPNFTGEIFLCFSDWDLDQNTIINVSSLKNI